MRPGRFAGVLFLSMAGVGLLTGCGRALKTPPDPLAAWLPEGPRSQALLLLRAQLPKVIACPSTIELTEGGVSWVDLHSCHPEDLRRRLRFKDVQAVRLIWQKVHMGTDARWLEALHNGSWVPVGRGSGLAGEDGMRALEAVKTALERLGPGRETPHRWEAHARPYLF